MKIDNSITYGFKDLLQELIDQHILQVCYKKREEEICTLTGEEPFPAGPKLLVIHFTNVSLVPSGRQPIVIQAPSPFPYKSEKAMPWRYGTNMLRSKQEQRQIRETRDSKELVIDNIAGIGGMTRSGHLFIPPELRNEEGHRNGVAMEKAKVFLIEKAQQVDEEPDGEAKKEILDVEACEFLKFIQQSKYKVVDQLNRMSARISLLELLMHLTSHRKLLMKILSRAHVKQDISVNKFEGIVNHIQLTITSLSLKMRYPQRGEVTIKLFIYL